MVQGFHPLFVGHDSRFTDLRPSRRDRRRVKGVPIGLEPVNGQLRDYLDRRPEGLSTRGGVEALKVWSR
jgi:hypothetical protein